MYVHVYDNFALVSCLFLVVVLVGETFGRQACNACVGIIPTRVHTARAWDIMFHEHVAFLIMNAVCPVASAAAVVQRW
jgi:hypothetical protein